jgi:hypothetical protein
MLLRRKTVALALAAVIAMLTTGPVQAFMMSLGGPTGLENGHILGGADALYAIDRAGREVKIADTGTAGPAGVIFQDLGIPSVAADGSVLFGAAIVRNHQLRWSIFVAKPDSRSSVPIAVMPSADDAPEMMADPRPVSTPDGALIFAAHDSSEGDAVFKLLDGKLSRLLRTADRLRDGRIVRSIGFGSVQPAGRAGVVLLGKLQPGGEAELLLSDSGAITVIASEDDEGSQGVHFRSFGLPAASASDAGTLVAFTARTNRGPGLFRYTHGKLSQVLSGARSCRSGKLNYLSTASPGLNGDGVIAIHGSCSGNDGIFLVRNGTATMVMRAHQESGYDGQFSYIGDPLLSDAGDVFFGATGADGMHRVFSVFGRNVSQVTPVEDPFEDRIVHSSMSRKHTVEGASMSINQRGQIAYLGSN